MPETHYRCTHVAPKARRDGVGLAYPCIQRPYDMSERTTWVRVEDFVEPVDEMFRALDAFLRTAGVAVQRFAAGPAVQALYVENLPWEENHNWRLDPAPHAGPVLLCSAATPDDASEHLCATLGGPETLQWARVVSRTRIPEGLDHLRGRARWFSRRHGDS